MRRNTERRPWGVASGLLALALAMPVHGESSEGGHIRSLGGAEPGKATIEDIAWLAGSWAGAGFGGEIEEIWSRPVAGTMVGLYKHRKGDEINFYEIQLLTEESGTLLWKVKHFSPEFVGWEEKDGYLTFPLVEITEDAAYFDGLTVERRDDGITMWLRVRSGDEMREEELVYQRAPLPGD